MTSQAHVKDDWVRQQVGIAIKRGDNILLQWPQNFQEIRVLEDGVEADQSRDWLYLNYDDARALYDALANHFGHTGHDMRALRKDYESERKRVDTFILHLTKDR